MPDRTSAVRCTQSRHTCVNRAHNRQPAPPCPVQPSRKFAAVQTMRADTLDCINASISATPTSTCLALPQLHAAFHTTQANSLYQSDVTVNIRYPHASTRLAPPSHERAQHGGSCLKHACSGRRHACGCSQARMERGEHRRAVPKAHSCVDTHASATGVAATATQVLGESGKFWKIGRLWGSGRRGLLDWASDGS